MGKVAVYGNVNDVSAPTHLHFLWHPGHISISILGAIPGLAA